MSRFQRCQVMTIKNLPNRSGSWRSMFSMPLAVKGKMWHNLCSLTFLSYVSHTKYKTPPNPKTHRQIHCSAADGGSRHGGFKQIWGYRTKKAFFLRFLDFPGAPRALRRRAKKPEKGRFRPISGKGGQTPLKPPFVTPPFAAAQIHPNPRDPDILKTVRIVNLLSVVNWLRVVIHYWRCSESLRFVLMYYILSSESLCVVNSLRSSKALGNQTPYYNSTGGFFGTSSSKTKTYRKNTKNIRKL